jgi:hypothetical protein
MTMVRVEWPVTLGSDNVSADLLYGQSLNVQVGVIAEASVLALTDLMLRFAANTPFPETGNSLLIDCTTTLHGVEFQLQIKCERRSDDLARFSTGQATLKVPKGKSLLGVTTEESQATLSFGREALGIEGHTGRSGQCCCDFGTAGRHVQAPTARAGRLRL